MFRNLFPENRAVHEIMWKNVVQPDRPQMTTQYGAYALHATGLKLQTHSEYVNYCFSTATMVTRTRLFVTFATRTLSDLLIYINVSTAVNYNIIANEK